MYIERVDENRGKVRIIGADTASSREEKAAKGEAKQRDRFHSPIRRLYMCYRPTEQRHVVTEWLKGLK